MQYYCFLELRVTEASSLLLVWTVTECRSLFFLLYPTSTMVACHKNRINFPKKTVCGYVWIAFIFYIPNENSHLKSPGCSSIQRSSRVANHRALLLSVPCPSGLPTTLRCCYLISHPQTLTRPWEGALHCWELAHRMNATALSVLISGFVCWFPSVPGYLPWKQVKCLCK